MTPLVHDNVLPDPSAYRAACLAMPFRSHELAQDVVFHGIGQQPDRSLPDWIEAHCMMPSAMAEPSALEMYDWQLWATVNHYRVKTDAQAAGTVKPDGTVVAPVSAFENRRSQIVAVQNLRQHVFPNGHLREGCNIREAKEVLTTCNVMCKTLMDNHERIMSMERMRAVEAATVDILIEIEDGLKEQFLERLRVRLEGLS